MRNESVPTPSSPERPPLAPYDPPDPAPQADAWRRAIKVVAKASLRVHSGSARPRLNRNRSAARMGTFGRGGFGYGD